MLTKEELKEYEKIVGLNLWQVEKDYLQHILLLFLYQRIKREMVFKGGTALQKVFGLNRFSIDLDFTLRENKVENILSEVVKDITNFGFTSNLSKIERTKISKTIILKIKGPLYNGNERTVTTFRIEISLRKDLILEPIMKEVVPVYSDLRAYSIVMMNLEEILAEKVRAIQWRAKARDLYDLWFLLKKGVKVNIDLIKKKLDYYKMKFDEEKFLENIEFLRNRWDLELRPLVNVLPSFDIVKKDIFNIFKKIENK